MSPKRLAERSAGRLPVPQVSPGRSGSCAGRQVVDPQRQNATAGRGHPLAADSLMAFADRRNQFPHSEQMRRDLRLATWLGAALMVSTLIPPVVHHRSPVPGHVYYGVERYINDHLCYLMWVNQVRQGHVKVRNLYVQDAPDRFPPSPIWLFIGLAGRVVPVGTVMLYHGTRVLLGIWYLRTLFALCAMVLQGRGERWVAWWLVALGGGLGWAWLGRGETTGLEGMWVSADLMPETWSYPSLLHFPHFALSLLLVVGAMVLLCRSWEGLGWLPSAAAGGLLSLLVLTHTYTAVALAAVLGLHAVMSWALSDGGRRVAGANLVALACSGAGFALQWWQVHHYETLRLWAASHAMPSPAPASYLLGFGLVGVVGLWGLGRLLGSLIAGRPPSPQQLLLVAWVLGTAIMLYSSLSFERRCVEGLHIPLALLAAPLVVRAARGLAGRRAGRVPVYAGLFVAACAPGSVWYVTRDIPSRVGYVERDILEAERAACNLLGLDTRLLCSGFVGQWVGAQGRLRVYLGHHQLSFGHLARQRLVGEFFAASTEPSRRLELLRASGCVAVLAWGWQAERLRQDTRDARGGRLWWRELFRGPQVGLFVPAQSASRPTRPVTSHSP